MGAAAAGPEADTRGGADLLQGGSGCEPGLRIGGEHLSGETGEVRGAAGDVEDTQHVLADAGGKALVGTLKQKNIYWREQLWQRPGRGVRRETSTACGGGF